MTKILVTGGMGFLGWNLVHALRRLKPDAHITVLDNLWTGARRKSEAQDQFIQGDVANDRWFDENTFDEIYHLASPASPKHYQARPHDTTRANVYGTFNCLRWLKPGGLMFYSSTSEVYGDPVVSPQPESYKGQVNCIGPRACYDEAKRCSESILFDAHRQDGVNIKVVRYFNAYGPGTLPDDGRAVSNFVAQALQGLPITVYGTGEQTRCFTFMNDIIAGTLRFVYDTDYTGPLNLGVARETPVIEIARFVQRLGFDLTGVTSPIIHEAPAVDDPQQRKPDLTLAESLIGWDPVVPYEIGIEKTLLHFREEFFS